MVVRPRRPRPHGGGLALQAVEKGIEVIAYDPKTEPGPETDILSADSVAALVEQLPSPRVVFVSVPQGDPTEEVVHAVSEAMVAGDVIIEGGNSHWQDSVRRFGELAQRGDHFLDCGTSGGRVRRPSPRRRPASVHKPFGDKWQYPRTAHGRAGSIGRRNVVAAPM